MKAHFNRADITTDKASPLAGEHLKQGGKGGLGGVRSNEKQPPSVARYIKRASGLGVFDGRLFLPHRKSCFHLCSDGYLAGFYNL